MNTQTQNALVLEALGLKAASAAIEKTMIDVMKDKAVSATDKLTAIKNLHLHQWDLELKYQRAMAKCEGGAA
jgi:hypothetical protein